MKRTILYILLLLLPLCAVAQERKVQNKPYIDYRRLHYGFFVGMHLQDMEFANNGFVTENGEVWYADIANYNPGFSVGVLADLRLNTYLSLRAIPTMHFGQNSVIFREQNSGEISKQSFKTTYIALPIHVKYAAERFNNYRPYITAGVSPMFNLTVKKQQQLLLKTFDFMIEIGFGCDFYLPFFKLIPELKFAFSPLNVLNKNRDDLLDANYLKFTHSVDKVVSKMIILSLYFE
ncbi:MAG: PorT family protein [Bacteroidaceae bacterium]|nr:PorT family protein [Bacteroidaceae bacterium]MBR4966682.1 PorT family protein [Bacteroidaceae bacterium]